MILAGEGQISNEHLPTQLRDEGRSTLALRAAVESFERRHIEWVLAANDGNRELTARALQIDPATLYRRLAKYGLS